tara:strand:+ start:516 stop:836 length:321 start_codon:yes stop_codon:yes gene_type:complete
MATKEELQSQADAEIEAKKTANGGDGMFVASSAGRVEYNEQQYETAKTDLGNQKWQQQQFGYIGARLEAYASLSDQLDMQYWDAVNGTTTWQDHVAQVKADNPKPS